MLNSSCEHPMRSGWPHLFVSHHELTVSKLLWIHGQLILWAHKCEISVTSPMSHRKLTGNSQSTHSVTSSFMSWWVRWAIQNDVAFKYFKWDSCDCASISWSHQVEDPGHPWINRVCTRLPVLSSLISYGDHQHWRMLRHGNFSQCTLSLYPWALHCSCPELYSVDGSPRISCAARRNVI